ncbi:TetR/AcrR family transcriptional regulator [Actinomadura citrea]|jgi:TetR/AcrR family transcriptional repressor of nem operon|uniref:TetR/AcrR family transcriptional repressor of nem operon n=1 Tax=Actinomadura citrea TaxID=46158 RepID=A0A7Y9KFS6_9ACTN|nr:TetR/AcrR family transcriptional regulator [Actinomadura citrea]NYE15910.1 TetR/AcrR family transcriptional repressor of nem operon [Actinomadura citrea]GGT67983.1 TetR family transcriptional regulator [Actinomadura citrea]
MARTKEFDPDAALLRALELFWERGYEATSMADLVAHLGIARASVYATFGGKRELYLKALERYLRDTDPKIAEALSQPGPVLPAVLALIEGYAEESAHGRPRLGCLVVNTAVELAARDAEAARLVEASWNFLEASLTTALTRARAQGELSPDKDPRALARLLLVLFQGMRVLGRAPADDHRLRDATRQAAALFT